MKKSLLFITAILFVVTLFGQRAYNKGAAIPKHQYYKAVKETQFIPSQRSSHYIPQAKGEGVGVVGETSWSAISNASARNTVSAHPSGDMVNVWTFEYNDGSKRGTGYNKYNKTTNEWDPMPTERLEDIPANQRPGFPSHAFTENGEIIVSHVAANNSLIILTREERGTGNWAQSYISEPDYSSGLFWPSVCASGNTVHAICVFDYDANNQSPLYYRSKDGGKSWDKRAYPFPEMPERDRKGCFADNYMIVSKGDHVVFAYANIRGDYLGRGNVGYIESLDGGDTWTHKPVYNCNFDDVNEYRFVSETVTAAIDDNDIVHVAFNGYPMPNQESWEPWASAIIYWKSSMQPLNPNDIAIREEGDYVYFDYLSLPNVISMPELLGFNEWWDWGADDEWIQGNNYMGPVCAPRIVAEGGKVYLTYSSIIEGPMGFYSGSPKAFYRGVFLTVSNDNGDTFDQLNNTSWLSYGEDFILYDWSEYKGPKDVTDPEGGFLGVIDPLYLSDNSYPTMAINSADGNLLLQWAKTNHPGELSGGDSYYIYTMILEKKHAGVLWNTREVWQGKWNDFHISINDVTGGIEEMIIAPNPAQGKATVSINSICSKPYTLSVMNTMGQVMFTQKGQLTYGQNSIDLNINNLTSGLYLVNIKTDNATRTQKLIVK